MIASHRLRAVTDSINKNSVLRAFFVKILLFICFSSEMNGLVVTLNQS